MALNDELPLFRAHDGGNVSRGDQRIKPGGTRFQQHGHRRPGQTAGQQYKEVVRYSLDQQCGRGCRGGFETGGKKDDGFIGIVAGNACGLLRRGYRAYIATPGPGLFQGACLATTHVNGDPQHVTIGHQDDVLVQ